MAQIKVKGMSCEHCSKAVTETMKSLGAKSVKVDLLSGKVDFEHTEEIEAKALKAAIDKLGFELIG
jgi:copper chaperone CopZ